MCSKSFVSGASSCAFKAALKSPYAGFPAAAPALQSSTKTTGAAASSVLYASPFSSVFNRADLHERMAFKRGEKERDSGRFCVRVRGSLLIVRWKE